MRDYASTEIRNVAVVGHGASGKTTLVDALAFVSGSSKRHGSIKEGTALTDFSPEEIEGKYSINLGCAYAEWMDTKINLIDAPGYADSVRDVRVRRHWRRWRTVLHRLRNRRLPFLIRSTCALGIAVVPAPQLVDPGFTVTPDFG